MASTSQVTMSSAKAAMPDRTDLIEAVMDKAAYTDIVVTEPDPDGEDTQVQRRGYNTRQMRTLMSRLGIRFDLKRSRLGTWGPIRWDGYKTTVHQKRASDGRWYFVDWELRQAVRSLYWAADEEEGWQ